MHCCCACGSKPDGTACGSLHNLCWFSPLLPCPVPLPQDTEDLDHYEMKEEEPAEGKKSEDDGIGKENLAILEKIKKNQRQDYLNVGAFPGKLGPGGGGCGCGWGVLGHPTGKQRPPWGQGGCGVSEPSLVPLPCRVRCLARCRPLTG